MSIEQQFHQLKKQILQNKFSRMNEMQRKAVFTVNGPLLILAGAGSGKTTVIVNRIAYLVNYGNAYFSDQLPDGLCAEDIVFLENMASGKFEDEGMFRRLVADHAPRPWNVLAITFTNKAAGELKERLEAMLGDAALDINAGTFHSQCMRILRRNIDRLGYSSSFTVYDTDDSVRVIKDSLSALGLSDKVYPPKAVLGEISRAKDQMLTPEEYERQAGSDFRRIELAKIYRSYQHQLKSSNALDFDDIICLTVVLLEQNPDLLERYRDRFRYILVDEYQDTNHAQYRLVSLLSGGHQNLCVVGDDDQSIYKFRGATIENILSFEKQFQNATVIRLEQNYRSTQNILSAANAVIENNTGRKGKNLWTDKGDGEPVSVCRVNNENAEADFIASTISQDIESGMKFRDHAILYRMNAQSATIERYFVRAGIPYRIVGGTKFYDRKEIKDILAYMSVVNNTGDNLRLKRIINEPKRGIGPGTVGKVQEIADGLGLAMFDVLRNADTYAALVKKAASLRDFSNMIEQLREDAVELPLDEFLDSLIARTGYVDELKKQGKEGQTRIENIQELKTNLIKFRQENHDATLGGFLEEVALYTDLDSFNASDDSVTMMTMHSAKGLEFPVVFIAGMEEGIFPGVRSIGEPDELEEERRLAYVGITRAKKKLYITNAAQRMLFGNTKYARPSRFIGEIPEHLVDSEDKTVSRVINFEEESRRVVQPQINVDGVGLRHKAEAIDIDYTTGDRVRHSVFGEGTILSMQPMGNDVLVEVAFDKKGNKKIMANFAKLKKL